MGSSPPWRYTWLAAITIAGLVACKRPSPPVATLAELTGTVESQHGSEPAAWSPAATGEQYAVGDAVRTETSATARLRLARGGELRLEPETVVRFQRTPRKGLDLEVEAGAVAIEAGDAEIVLETALGEARVARGGRARVSREAGKTRLEVLFGTVIVEGVDGREATLRAGEHLEVDVGDAILEDDDGVAATAADAAPVDPPTGSGGATPSIEVDVDGEGVTAQIDDQWVPLASGGLAPGTRVRVPQGTSLAVHRGAERAQVRGEAEIVVGGGGGALIEAERGTIDAEATDQNVTITVPGGTIVVRALPGGSSAAVSVGSDGDASVAVARGEVTVSAGGTDQVVESGERAAIAASGAVEVETAGPTEVDLSFRAGESSVVHDPTPPTAIGIRFDCAGVGKVEIAGKRGFKKPAAVASGEDQANLLLAAGRHRYRVVCDGAARASGTVTIQRDAARKQLPTRPPHNVVDADGRHYTVLYQNLLPELVLRWTDAPAGPYVLHVVSGRDERTIDTTEARHTLGSGQLREGAHRWWFEAAGTRSPETNLTIDFDNAAATAYIRRVERTADGHTRVEGAAVRDATVTLAGDKVELDAHWRFTAEAARGPGQRSISLRIIHGAGRLDYYVLRTE